MTDDLLLREDEIQELLVHYPDWTSIGGYSLTRHFGRSESVLFCVEGIIIQSNGWMRARSRESIQKISVAHPKELPVVLRRGIFYFLAEVEQVCGDGYIDSFYFPLHGGYKKGSWSLCNWLEKIGMVSDMRKPDNFSESIDEVNVYKLHLSTDTRKE